MKSLSDTSRVATCHDCGRSVPLLPTEDLALKDQHPWRYIFHFRSLDPRGGLSYCPASGLPVRERAQPTPSTPTAISMHDFY